MACRSCDIPQRLAKADKKSFAQTERMVKSFKWGMAYVAPRGVGPTAWGQNERRQTQVRRRFMLLGQTLDGMRTFDVVRAVGALRLVDGMDKVPLWMQGEKTMEIERERERGQGKGKETDRRGKEFMKWIGIMRKNGI